MSFCAISAVRKGRPAILKLSGLGNGVPLLNEDMWRWSLAAITAGRPVLYCYAPLSRLHKPQVAVECLVYSVLAHGSAEGCQLLCMLSWGLFGEGPAGHGREQK